MDHLKTEGEERSITGEVSYSRSITHSGVTRSAAAAIGLLLCFWGIWISGRDGFSRLLSNRVRKAPSLTAASKAIRLSPSDPQAYYARARVLSNRGRLAEAIKDYETAVALRPDDHSLWLRLGYARYRFGDQQGALAAYEAAVRLAPYYAQPRWYLGRLLLRARRRDEGFAELRLAATSNPKLFLDTVDRAWTVYKGEPRAVEQATQPQTPAARLGLARFFVEHGKATEAIELFRGTSGASVNDRLALLTALLTARRFTEAYEVWASGREASSKESRKDSRSGISAITDGSFERDISLDEPGFGWQLASNMKAVRISLDTNEPHTGAYSMRLDWTGDSNPSTPVVSQLVLVEPKTRYRLSFAVRTQEMLTIGLPMVTVTDASSDDERVLSQSTTFPRGTSGWQDYTLEFATAETTSGVRITIRRENCNMVPCPILGHVWVDDFSLEKL